MINTTTYVHVHDDDKINIKPTTNQPDRLTLTFGDHELHVFVPAHRADELRQAIADAAIAAATARAATVLEA